MGRELRTTRKEMKRARRIGSMNGLCDQWPGSVWAQSEPLGLLQQPVAQVGQTQFGASYM